MMRVRVKSKLVSIATLPQIWNDVDINHMIFLSLSLFEPRIIAPLLFSLMHDDSFSGPCEHRSYPCAISCLMRSEWASCSCASTSHYKTEAYSTASVKPRLVQYLHISPSHINISPFVRTSISRHTYLLFSISSAHQTLPFKTSQERYITLDFKPCAPYLPPEYCPSSPPKQSRYRRCPPHCSYSPFYPFHDSKHDLVSTRRFLFILQDGQLASPCQTSISTNVTTCCTPQGGGDVNFKCCDTGPGIKEVWAV